MANTFKSLVAPLVGPTTTVYTVPASTTTIVIGMRIGNETTQDSWVTVDLFRSLTAYKVVSSQTPVPAGGALEGVQGSKLVLQEGDEIVAIPQGDNELAMVLSVMEIT